MRVCSKCELNLPLSAFAPSKYSPDGAYSRCRKCVNESARERHAADPEKQNAKVRERNASGVNSESRERAREKYLATHPDASKIAVKKYREKYPERALAREAVRAALRYGRMTRGDCAECGQENAEAHHEDYSQPLKVVWLCRKHHMARHRTINSQQRTETRATHEQ